MPKVAKTDAVTEEVAKRAPRRRVARAPRKSASTKANLTDTTKETERNPVRRKAPTRINEVVSDRVNKTSSISSRKGIYVTLSLAVMGFAAAVFIGYSDDGQINTASVISELNNRIEAGEKVVNEAGVETKVVPVQNTSKARPVSSGQSKTAPIIPTEPASEETSSTATSSDAKDTATTTNPIAEEEVVGELDTKAETEPVATEIES